MGSVLLDLHALAAVQKHPITQLHAGGVRPVDRRHPALEVRHPGDVFQSGAEHRQAEGLEQQSADDPKCTGERGLQCKNPTSELRVFTKNYSTSESAIRCPKEAHPDLALPHDPLSYAPAFYPLACCLKSSGSTGTLPEGAGPCEVCAPVRAKLLPARQQRCKDELDGNVTWMRYKDIVL